MTSPSSAASTGFWARANDLQCRDFPSRLSRYVRGLLRNGAMRLQNWADDPRAMIAWKNGWEAGHYVRLRRWRDRGFQPRTIFDIGAHRGDWSAMAQAVFAPAEIFLFEPQREFQERAMSQRPSTGAAWTMMPMALGDQDTSLPLHVTSNSAASSLLPPLDVATPKTWGTQTVRAETVAVARLDGLRSAGKLPRPDLVKIDVQGYELAVLKGGQQTMTETEAVVIEVSLSPLYHDQAMLPEVLQSLTSCGLVLEDVVEGARPWPDPPAQVDLYFRRRGQK